MSIPSNTVKIFGLKQQKKSEAEVVIMVLSTKINLAKLILFFDKIIGLFQKATVKA